MAEHKHGSMDTTQQERAFAGLIKASVWVCILTALTLIFLSIVATSPT